MDATQDELFKLVKDSLGDVGLCGEISDREGYAAACIMKKNHPGSHGWEPGVGNIKLVCRNPNCSDKGGFITRPIEDARKNLYACDTCHKPMER